MTPPVTLVLAMCSQAKAAQRGWWLLARTHWETAATPACYVTPAEHEAAYYRQTTPAPEPVTQ